MKTLKILILILFTTGIAFAQQNEAKILENIKKEGMENSQVMDLLSSLTDVHSPRLSGSDAYLSGAQWVRKKMESYGCTVTLEPYRFPIEGWEIKSFSIAMVSPRFEPIIAFPAAWTGSTQGRGVTDEPLLVDFLDIKVLKELEGKLKGRILLFPKAEERLGDQETVISDQEIKKYNRHKRTDEDRTMAKGYVKKLLQKDHTNTKLEEIMAFLRKEEVGALLMPSIWDNHVLEVSELPFHHLKNSVAVPTFNISKETHHKIKAMIVKGAHPKLSLMLNTEFYDRPANNVNILATIKGCDTQLTDETVIAGAHFDTWHAGGNASDNNAGVAVIMEALRILKTIGACPKRSIQTGFWGGEEQEFYGSVSYLEDHLGNILTDKMKPGHKKLSAYYNIDSGGGAIRGFFLQGNDKAQKLLQPWGKPFKTWGLETINSSASGGSDHLIFASAGIPAFDAFQDPSTYWSLQHHSNVDEVLLIDEKTMKRNAVIMATFLYRTAMQDKIMPRN